MQKIRIIGFFFEDRLHWQFKVAKKNSTNGCFRLHIYLRRNKTLIHNFLYVFDNWEKNLSHEKDVVQLKVRKFSITSRAKPIRTIGDPDNQRPDNWSYIVFSFVADYRILNAPINAFGLRFITKAVMNFRVS
jgi:hypothetical protein